MHEKTTLWLKFRSLELSVNLKDLRVWARHGQSLLSIPFNYILLYQLFILFLIFWKYVIHLEKEMLGGKEMSNNDHMHWKIVDKCSHFTFFCLPSWQIKTEPSMSLTPGTEPLQSPPQQRQGVVLLLCHLPLGFLLCCWRPYLPYSCISNVFCILVAIKLFSPT